MGKRQSKFGKVIKWLNERIKMLMVREEDICERMRGVVRCTLD